MKKTGKQTVHFSSPPSIAAFASVVGDKEGQGPLGKYFDSISDDEFFGEKTWETAESAMLRHCVLLCCDKLGTVPQDIDYAFSGDLLNQCMGSAYAFKELGIPYFGLYGACSTMGESLSLAAMTIDGGFADRVLAATSSHFCSSERQFRFPLEYGGQRPPSSQWTVTGAGAVILSSDGGGVHIDCITSGKIKDAGIKDANNMGAAMAPAAYETLKAHFEDTGRAPSYYDLILTGDLGAYGHDNLEELFRLDGISLGESYSDCGLLIFDRSSRDVHAGGSGCGCSASVLCSYVLGGMAEGKWRRVLFAPTGALMSPTTVQQGLSISGICHAISLEV